MNSKAIKLFTRAVTAGQLLVCQLETLEQNRRVASDSLDNFSVAWQNSQSDDRSCSDCIGGSECQKKTD